MRSLPIQSLSNDKRHYITRKLLKNRVGMSGGGVKFQLIHEEAY